VKSTKELRNFLLEQMVGVAEGRIDINTAKGVSNLSQQVYNTINIELKMAQAKNKMGSDVPVLPVEFDD
jgi:hypothetical protein